MCVSSSFDVHMLGRRDEESPCTRKLPNLAICLGPNFFPLSFNRKHRQSFSIQQRRLACPRYRKNTQWETDEAVASLLYTIVRACAHGALERCADTYRVGRGWYAREAILYIIHSMETNKVTDSVKRRFIRQNRELAKYAITNVAVATVANVCYRSNSSQSIRIRALEADCSRLLAENLSLKEQVNDLKYQLEGRSNRCRPSADIVSSVKHRLEEKLQEFGLLIAELDRPVKPVTTTAKRKSLLRTTRFFHWCLL